MFVNKYMLHCDSDTRVTKVPSHTCRGDPAIQKVWDTACKAVVDGAKRFRPDADTKKMSAPCRRLHSFYENYTTEMLIGAMLDL